MNSMGKFFLKIPGLKSNEKKERGVSQYNTENKQNQNYRYNFSKSNFNMYSY